MTRTRLKIVEAEPEPELKFQADRTRSRNWRTGGIVRRGMERSRHGNWWIRSGRGVIFTALVLIHEQLVSCLPRLPRHFQSLVVNCVKQVTQAPFGSSSSLFFFYRPSTFHNSISSLRLSPQYFSSLGSYYAVFPSFIIGFFYLCRLFVFPL